MNKYTIIVALIFFCISGCKKEKAIIEAENQQKDEPSFTLPCEFTNFYYYQDKKNILGEMNANYLLIGSDSSNKNSDIEAYFNGNTNFDSSYNFSIIYLKGIPYKYFIVKLSKETSCERIAGIINEIEKSPLVSFAHYTIQAENCLSPIGEPMGNKCVYSSGYTFYVKVKDENDLSGLDSIMKSTNITTKEQNRFAPEWYTLYTNKLSKGDAMQMANYFYETGLFITAEPDIMHLTVE